MLLPVRPEVLNRVQFKEHRLAEIPARAGPSQNPKLRAGGGSLLHSTRPTVGNPGAATNAAKTQSQRTANRFLEMNESRSSATLGGHLKIGQWRSGQNRSLPTCPPKAGNDAASDSIFVDTLLMKPPRADESNLVDPVSYALR